jgi:hypothetical protein
MEDVFLDKRAAARASRAQEREALALRLYRTMLETWVEEGSPRLRSGTAEAARLLATSDPDDLIDTLLTQQTMWLHARMGHLSHFASIQKNHRSMQMLHEAADRAAGACRRHLMALAEYRDPSRRKFMAVKQANIAQQIVVTPRRKRGRPRKIRNDEVVMPEKIGDGRGLPEVVGGDRMGEGCD